MICINTAQITFGQRDFPAVTICSRNPYKASKVTDLKTTTLINDYTNSVLNDAILNPDTYYFNVSQFIDLHQAYYASSHTQHVA